MTIEKTSMDNNKINGLRMNDESATKDTQENDETMTINTQMFKSYEEGMSLM